MFAIKSIWPCCMLLAYVTSGVLVAQEVEDKQTAPKVAGSKETDAKATDTKKVEMDESIYSVTTYQPERDPKKDLEATVKRAKRDGKRIILEIGGEW